MEPQRPLPAVHPGGRLAVIGLAADKSIADLLADAPAVPADRFYRAIRHRGESGAPIMDPQMTWREVRIEAARLLPGARYRRRLLWRYSLLWRNRTPNLPARRQPTSAGVPPVIRRSSA